LSLCASAEAQNESASSAAAVTRKVEPFKFINRTPHFSGEVCALRGAARGSAKNHNLIDARRARPCCRLFDCGFRIAECGLKKLRGVAALIFLQSEIRNPKSAIFSTLRRAPLLRQLHDGERDGRQEEDVYVPSLT